MALAGLFMQKKFLAVRGYQMAFVEEGTGDSIVLRMEIRPHLTFGETLCLHVEDWDG
jgi:hypothetical protein